MQTNTSSPTHLDPQIPLEGTVGLGLRRALLNTLRDAPVGDFDFLEVAPENWIGIASR
jgi:uncharacterized protein